MWEVVDVTDVNFAFGPSAIAKLLPAYADIPGEFKSQRHPWVRFMEDWFFRGITAHTLTPRKGIDTDKALQHIGAIMRSWEPAHEHKTAGVAYLLSQWFTDASWTPRGGEPTTLSATG